MAAKRTLPMIVFTSVLLGLVVLGVLVGLGQYFKDATPQQYLVQAKDQVKRKQFDAALVSLESAAKKLPKDHNIDMMKGQIYTRKKDLAKARASFEQARAKSPNDPRVHQKLATTYQALKMPAEAEKELKLLAEQSPDDSKTQLNLALFYLQNKQEARALELLKAMEKKAPDSADVHLGLGTYYQSQKQIDKTREHYQRFIQLKPKASIQTVLRVLTWVKQHPPADQAAKPGAKAGQALKPAAAPQAGQSSAPKVPGKS